MKKSFLRFNRRFVAILCSALLLVLAMAPQSAGAFNAGSFLMQNTQFTPSFTPRWDGNGELRVLPIRPSLSTRMNGMNNRFLIDFGNTSPTPPDDEPTTEPDDPPQPPQDGGNGPSKGIITLSFDDGYESIYQEAVPRLNAAQLKGTFYINTGFLGENPYMNGTQVLAIQSAGHEIGAHTRTHAHLGELSMSEKENEIIGSKNDLLALGITTVTSFAYPYGEFDDESIAIVKDGDFLSARTTQGGFNQATQDPYLLQSRNLTSATTMADVQGWIDGAVDGDYFWQVFTFHKIEADSDDEYSTSPAMLQEIIDYLIEHNVQVVTVSQGAAMLQ